MTINSNIIINIVAASIGGLVVAFTLFLITRLKNFTFNIFSLRDKKRKIEKGLEEYKETLEEKTLKVSHPWMKEEQTLNDILVPINFKPSNKAETEREQLEVYVKQVFKKKSSPRILILGKPGSGKTIAVRVMTRLMWEIEHEKGFVPVLLEFSDIKGVFDKKGLEAKIVEKLKYYQFEQGKNNIKSAEEFIQENLYGGRVVLLFDGYDELEKSARESISKVLNNFLGTYSKIPAVITSRTEVYERDLSFDKTADFKIDMASFTPYAILKFLSIWKFEEGKSSQALFNMIKGKAHLLELASNPLMLTIITFLYSKPKYTLPDNRVQFYDMCTRALLEEWDMSQGRNRPNRFESSQKIIMLSKIAFEHISQAAKTDELISEEKIHEIIREEMKRIGLKVDEYTLMRDEIVFNSGILQRIPPKDYRFPHRTFMEFFAANYITNKKDWKTVINLYDQDAEKWKQTILLYLGLNENREHSRSVLNHLKKDFESSRKESKPNLLVFSALTECAVPDPELANEILNLAKRILNQNSSLAIIEELGYIAANPRWAYAKRAKEILLGLLKQDLDNNAFQQTIFSLLHARDKSIDQIIADSLKRINLSKFFSNIGSNEKYFVKKLFELRLSKKEKQDFIKGLKEAGNFELLSTLLVESKDQEIKEYAAYSLFRLSKLEGFFEFLDSMESGLLEQNTKKLIDQEYSEWGWDWDLPKTENGKKAAFLICHFTAKWFEKNYKNFKEDVLEQVNNRFRYLVTGLMVKKGIKFYDFNLIGFNQKTANLNGLKRHWQKRVNLDNFWYKLCGVADDEFWLLIGVFLYWLVSIAGIVGFTFHWLGFTSNPFYNYLFDGFTVNFLFIQFICFYILHFIMYTVEEGYEHLVWFYATSGGVVSFHFIFEKAPRLRKLLLLLSFGVSLVCLFLPFHNNWFNILLFLHFLLIGIRIFDDSQINFGLLFHDHLKKIYKFLEEK